MRRSATSGPRSSFGGVVPESPGAAGAGGGGRGLVAAASVAMVCAAAGVVCFVVWFMSMAYGMR